MTGPRWHALSVHTRSEMGAADDVQRFVPEAFVPVRVVRRAWSDRVKVAEEPLFPGYVFVRAELSAALRVQLLKSRHVVDLTGRLPGDERIARAIPDAQMDALRILINAERSLDPIEKLVKGTPVLVATGALKGARGVVEQGPDGQRRLVVQVALLGRGVRTVLQADDVVESIQGLSVGGAL